MKRDFFGIVIIAFLAIFLWNCSISNKSELDESRTTLFEKIPSSVSGIKFKNHITERLEYFENFSYAYNGGGTAIGDINNDGLQDIFFTGNEVENKLYLNKGNFVFEDITLKSNIKSIKGWNNGVTMVDINADGFLDIYVCRGGWGDTKEQRKNLLFVNQGDSTFKEMAEDYGISDTGYSTQASFFDFDNDNDLDLYIVNRPSEFGLSIPETLYNKEHPSDDQRDKLYKNENGVFIEVAQEMGITHNFAYGLGIVTADVNKDGFIDIYITNDFDEHDYLYINQEGKSFKESIKTMTNHNSLYAMGVDIMDLNNDGLEDIFVTEMLPADFKQAKISMPSMNVEKFEYLVEKGFFYQYMHNTLQLNQGNNKFSEISKFSGVDKTGWSWAVLASDFDNDGKKDLLITNGFRRDIFDNDLELRMKDFFNKNKSKYKSGRELIAKKGMEIINLYKPIKEINYLYKNIGNLKFEDVSKKWGFKNQSFSNGASVGDLDNDGDLDIVINNLDDEAFIFENKTNGSKNYLRIELKGPKGNTLGLGAKIEIVIGNEKQYQEFKMVRGYLSSQEPIVHFGIGNKNIIDSLIVTWLGGEKQILIDVEHNQKIIVDFVNVSNKEKPQENKIAKLFSDTDTDFGLDFRHVENKYNDFEKENLLPHKYSQTGPGITTGDINNDGLEDVYICGASGKSGALYIQNKQGNFKKVKGPWENNKLNEEVSVVFFDANNDGKMDLYVVSGGNEFKIGDKHLKDKLYLNLGNAIFKDASNQIPNNAFSGSKVKPFDFDNDGDVDLFVTGRLIPQNYPNPASGYLYRNDKGVFTDVTKEIAPELINLGLITDALWVDYDGDNKTDLIIVGEWMPLTIFRNSGELFEKVDQNKIGLVDSEGWWYSVEAADFDNDGDIDIVAGNVGLNYKYRTSKESPFEVYSSDFDHNGQLDIILGFEKEGKLYPVRGKECSTGQMPFLNNKFKTYKDFSNATIVDMVGEKEMSLALNLKAKTFASSYFENKGNGTFEMTALLFLSQFSTVNDILIDDFDSDGHLDMILGGNLYTTEIETTRLDASYGVFLSGDGKGNFTANYPYQSGLYIGGDVKELSVLKVKGSKILLVAKNNEVIQIVKINSVLK